MANDSEFLGLLYQALASKYGVELRVFGDKRAALNKLYAARKKSLDTDLLCLQFRQTNDESIFWIVKGSANGEG